MLSIGFYVYFFPLLAAAGYAVYKKAWEAVTIAAVLSAAFIITRYITNNVEGPRYMPDLLNDMGVMVFLLFCFDKNNLLVRLLAISYAAMTFGGYIPVAVNIMSPKISLIVLEVIGISHILIILGGTSDGYRNRNLEGIRDRVHALRGSGASVVRSNKAVCKKFGADGTLHVERVQ